MDRRRFLIATAAGALSAAPGFAQEAFPSHAITIINAFPPGGANDIVTRPLATAMEPILKQPPSPTAIRCSRTIPGSLVTPRSTSSLAVRPR